MATQSPLRKQRRASEPIAARIASDLLAGCVAVTESEQATERVLQVFVVHQNHDAGLRAKQAIEDVRWQLNLGPCFQLSLWRGGNFHKTLCGGGEMRERGDPHIHF